MFFNLSWTERVNSIWFSMNLNFSFSFSFIGKLFIQLDDSQNFIWIVLSIINLFCPSIFIEYRYQPINLKNKSISWFLYNDNTELNGSAHKYQRRIHLSSFLSHCQETLPLVVSNFKNINYLLPLKNKKHFVFSWFLSERRNLVMIPKYCCILMIC